MACLQMFYIPAGAKMRLHTLARSGVMMINIYTHADVFSAWRNVFGSGRRKDALRSYSGSC